jgi:cell division protease FtsH
MAFSAFGLAAGMKPCAWIRPCHIVFLIRKLKTPSCAPGRFGWELAGLDASTIARTNGLLEQLDGLSGRQGLIFLAATNDVSRCDPALIRAGRLNRIIEVKRPGIDDLQKMFRVRLARDLEGADLRPVSELTLGGTGADVERIVKDARRAARQIDDLRNADVEQDDRPESLRRRAAVHEAGHILADVVHYGPDDVYATLALSKGHGGVAFRTKAPPLNGVYEDFVTRLEVLLAGRTAEEVLLGSASHGAVGAAGSDLDQATTVAAAMVASFGLTGPHPLLYEPYGGSPVLCRPPAPSQR